jgi:16S rRNA (guanine527-N7)-methyltransferase
MMPDNFVAHRDWLHIEKLAAALGHRLDERVLQQCARYVEMVANWNKRVDLTAARGAHAQAEVLLADALVLANRAIVPQATRLVDVGSGAGAPAIPLLLLRGDLTAVLVESKQKRVAFLNTAIGTLEIMDRVKVERQHLDIESPQVKGQPFDVAISRATFAPEVWLPVGLALAPRALLLTASAELPTGPAGSQRVQSYDYRLPESNAPRRITVYRGKDV